MRNSIILILTAIPALIWAQSLEFQLQPGAFPVSVSGFPMQQPWAGGVEGTTPKCTDLRGEGILDFHFGQANGYVGHFQNIGSAISPDFRYCTFFYDTMLNQTNGGGLSDINFADINADSKKEAFVGGGYILLYHNLGTSTEPNFYGPADTVKDMNGQNIVALRVALVDIDADGKLDLFAGQYYAEGLHYYHNIGTAENYAFQLVSSNWFNTYNGEGCSDPCFGDLDGDGDLDLLIGTGLGHVTYYRNDGSPTNPQMTPVPNFLNIAVQKDASPELADIDGDGDLDLFVGRSSSGTSSATQGDVFFYRNDGSPQQARFTFVTSNYLTWDNGQYATPQLADVNGDNLPDLLSAIGSHLLYYRNIGSPGYPSFVYESSNFGNLTVFDLEPWLVDLNGDGLLDIIAGTSAIPGPPVMQLYLNHGTPQSPLWQPAPLSLPPVFNQNSVILSPWTADIDGDGDQDLFVSDDNGYLYFFQNTGTPTNYQFQSVTNNWQGLNDGMGGHRFGCFYDMDSDGDLDLFLNSEAAGWFPFEKNLRFYRNHGTPQNPQMVLENNDMFPDLMIWQAAPFVLDIDQDGDGDLFVGDMWGGCRFFRNTGGSFVNPNPKRPEGPPERMITILPNPGNSGTTISYVLDHPQKISLDVYNLLGAKVATLASGLQLPGNYSYTWDASAKASGMYIVKLQEGGEVISRKVMVVK